MVSNSISDGVMYWHIGSNVHP